VSRFLRAATLTAGLTLGAGFGLAPPVSAVEVDLTAAVDLALAQNPGLQAVEERRREVEGGITEAKADAYPQLALTSSWSRSRNPSLLNSPDFDEFINQFPGGRFVPREQELKSFGLEISQPVFTFGKVGAAVDLAHQVADVAEARIDTERLDVALSAAEAYFQVEAARRALETVAEQERARREFLAVIQARYDIGEATRLELLQSQATLAELQPSLVSSQGALEQARARLRAVLGLPDGEPLEVRPPAEQAELPPAPPGAALLRQALERRPELRDLELQAEALLSQQEVTRADGRPQVEFTGLYGRQARVVDNLSNSLFDNWFFSLGMRWEFFDGGRRRGQIAQLESQRRQLALERRDRVLQVRLEIEESVAEYETARARLMATDVAARAAREAARVAQDSYQEGVALQADWLDAQQRETEAEIRLVDARFTARIQAARLLRALGSLPTAEVAEALGGAGSQDERTVETR
jgi:outer membrane protein